MKNRRPEILALIPARGGSQSIPRKNIISILGKPLIAYSIEQATSCQFITRTIVSTDDSEIAGIAKEFGAEIPFLRPKEFAQNESTDFDVFFHALTWLKEKENYSCDLVVHLRPTGPVRKISLIEAAIQKMLNTPEADSLRAVSYPLQTPYKMWHLKGEFLEPIVRLPDVEESYNLPRQKLPKVYWQNGYIDIVRPDTVLKLKGMSGKKILPLMIEEHLLELDYPEDIPRIEKALQNMTETYTLRDPV